MSATNFSCFKAQYFLLHLH